MKTYISPELNVINFSAEDIIVTSIELRPDELPILPIF